MMTPEGRIKKIVKRHIATLGDSVWAFMPVQSGYGKPALDFIMCVRGHFVTIETKREGVDDMTPLQDQTTTDTRRAGGLMFLVNSEERMRGVMEVLRALPWTRDFKAVRRAHEVSTYDEIREEDALLPRPQVHREDGGMAED